MRTAFVVGLLALAASAHEIRPALLEIKETRPGVFDVMWKVPARGSMVLRLRPVFPDRMELTAPPSVHATPGAMVEYTTLRSDGNSLEGEMLTIEGLERTQTDVLIRLRLLDGSSHSEILRPSSPSYTFPAPETMATVSWSYLQLGTIHILDGFDHLLFVLALVLILSNRWKLLKAVTAFTVAHSITLGLATLGFVNVPAAPVEAVISLSILFLAVEGMRQRRGEETLTLRSPWVVAFLFGLFHGLGFAGALSEIGLPHQDVPLALLMFNVGVELGQVVFIAAVLTVLAIARGIGVRRPLTSWRLLPYAIGSVAAFWTIERIASFA